MPCGCTHCMVFSRFPPWYSWNIVESGVKHHKPAPFLDFRSTHIHLKQQRNTAQDSKEHNFSHKNMCWKKLAVVIILNSKEHSSQICFQWVSMIFCRNFVLWWWPSSDKKKTTYKEHSCHINIKSIITHDIQDEVFFYNFQPIRSHYWLSTLHPYETKITNNFTYLTSLVPFAREVNLT